MTKSSENEKVQYTNIKKYVIFEKYTMVKKYNNVKKYMRIYIETIQMFFNSIGMCFESILMYLFRLTF